ncbi:VOC family protein [Microvirga tunisiensis]|uniref:VOC family protein n=1 Tax=Microvirga tunisiensis TaxID=2108360 RepID=A0A5N7MVN8_9HYPH|nr:VOC family protein [Microvirga tunisiensis]
MIPIGRGLGTRCEVRSTSLAVSNRQNHCAKDLERSRPFSTHVALATGDFKAALARLEQHGVTYVSVARQPKDITIRPDGVRQIYFQDPDGHWIEINDANGEP